MSLHEGIILGFDIENYSNNVTCNDMSKKRAELKELLKKLRLLELKGIDNGDGCFLFDESSNLEKYIKLFEALEKNYCDNISFRFRGVIHFGLWAEDESIIESQNNFVGSGLNETARYLDAKSLKGLLKQNSNKKFVFGITNSLFEKLERENIVDIDVYKEYTCIIKQFTGRLFLNIEGSSNFPEVEKDNTSADIKYSITDTFRQELKKADFTHTLNDVTSDLDTFYIPLECTYGVDENNYPQKKSSELVVDEFIESPKNIVFSGKEQCGKTSLLKHFFLKVYESNKYLPIFLTIKENEIGKLENKLFDAVKKEYGETRIDTNKIKIVFIDDFDSLKKKYCEAFIKFLTDNSDYFFVVSVNIQYLEIISNINLMNSFQDYTIKDCGHKIRNQFIEKWIDFTNKEDVNYQKTDELDHFLTATFMKGVIPFTPFYILTILQLKDSYIEKPDEITSKGYCYQALIYLSLRKSNISDNNIGTYLTIFSNLAFYFYENKRTGLSIDELENFFTLHANNYNVSFELDEFISKLEESSIFTKNTGGDYSFPAPYIYYYFVAKYIADQVTNGEKDSELLYQKVIANLQDKANAYISIFLVHHIKNQKMLSFIIEKNDELYSKDKECLLSNEDIAHIDKYCDQLLKLYIDKKDSSHEQREISAEYRDDEESTVLSKDDNEIENDILSEMNRALRTTEVLGLIIKDSQGQLKQDVLKEAYFSIIKVFMRICGMFLREFTSHEKDMLNFLEQRMTETKVASISKEQLSKEAYKIMGYFYFLSIYASIKNASNRIGSIELRKIAKDVASENQSTFMDFVYFTTQMWYEKRIPFDDMKKKFKDYSPTMKELCKTLLAEFSNFHKIDYRERSRICETFSIPLIELKIDRSK